MSNASAKRNDFFVLAQKKVVCFAGIVRSTITAPQCNEGKVALLIRYSNAPSHQNDFFAHSGIA